jgi:hypothetical protein
MAKKKIAPDAAVIDLFSTQQVVIQWNTPLGELTSTRITLYVLHLLIIDIGGFLGGREMPVVVGFASGGGLGGCLSLLSPRGAGPRGPELIRLGRNLEKVVAAFGRGFRYRRCVVKPASNLNHLVRSEERARLIWCRPSRGQPR